MAGAEILYLKLGVEGQVEYKDAEPHSNRLVKWVLC